MTSNYNYGTNRYGYGTTGYGGTYGTTGYGTTAGTTTGTTDAYGNANRTTYDPDTGAYDQHIDYNTDGTRRHHREQMDDTGRYYHRDVDTDTTGYDNTSRVHKEYSNPNTGTSYHRDTTYDRGDVYWILIASVVWLRLASERMGDFVLVSLI